MYQRAAQVGSLVKKDKGKKFETSNGVTTKKTKGRTIILTSISSTPTKDNVTSMINISIREDMINLIIGNLAHKRRL